MKKKVFSRILILLVTVLAIGVISFGVVFFKATYNVSLDTSKLVKASQISQIKLLYSSGEEIDTSGLFTDNLTVDISTLPEYVKNGFIATEDKRFYKHNGVDYKRMAGAMISNIKKGRFSEGASTISQQLIKNTHLTQEKTVDRKFKEIKLAYELEKKFTKEEILEMYLNNIYFGNGCYGIEKASRYYFDKSAKDLSLGESAMLVGVINAPSIYDPVSKQDNAEKRKKLVLKLMLKQGYISETDYQKNANSSEKIVKSASKSSNQHLKAILREACKVLKVSENQIKNMNITVYTSIDDGLQNQVTKMVSSSSFVPKNDNGLSPSAGIIVVDNDEKSVVAFAGNMSYNLLNHKRQPGSTFKPIIVYAPALESKKIYPESTIIDEKININGYSPSNANKTFSGAVTVRQAVEKSLNVPAVKVLSNTGIAYAKNFASKLGITFAQEDQNLALALGGMTDGVTIKELADAYSTFACSGNYSPTTFISKIEDSNGNVLYAKNRTSTRVMKDSTAYLMTDMLKGVVRNGTARRLNNYKFELASKTGTVGAVNSRLNTDAYNVAYTSEHTIVCWLGADSEAEYMKSAVNGATYPTEMSKRILNSLYVSHTPEDFKKPDSVVEAEIDTRSLDNKEVELANDLVLDKYKKTVLLDKDNLPPLSQNIKPHKTELVVNMEENQKPTFSFETKLENTYKLYRENLKSKDKKLLVEFTGDSTTKSYTDTMAVTGEIYEYYVVTTSTASNDNSISNAIKLMSY